VKEKIKKEEKEIKRIVMFRRKKGHRVMQPVRATSHMYVCVHT
jgi:hypothetical protein